MKKFFSFFITLVMCLSFSSCLVTAEAQADGVYVRTDGVDVDLIITYGTPYYNSDGLLLYYIYRDLYYYPYYLNNRWYFRSYSRPLRYYRPVPRDFYRHHPSNHRYGRNITPDRPAPRANPDNRRPSVTPNRPNTTSNRPNGGISRSNPQINNHVNVQPTPRSSSSPRPQMGGGSTNRGGGGHFGGRR